jgi:hypothetical protein
MRSLRGRRSKTTGDTCRQWQTTCFKTDATVHRCHELRTAPNPPSSPDHAASDFFLFRHLKKALQGSEFESAKELLDAVVNNSECHFTRNIADDISSLNGPATSLHWWWRRVCWGMVLLTSYQRQIEMRKGELNTLYWSNRDDAGGIRNILPFSLSARWVSNCDNLSVSHQEAVLGFSHSRSTPWTDNNWARNGWDSQWNFICRFWTLNGETGMYFSKQCWRILMS